MEQAQCLMWLRRQISEPHFQVSMNSLRECSTWEERAFAEDAAAPLGGCVWPPRSYSCSFCRREFRSAQALGGHMNVHRRDRARLKVQSLSPHREVLHHQNHNQSIPQKPFDPAQVFLPEDCTLDRTVVPNYKSSSPSIVAATYPPSRVSALSSSVIVQEQHKGALYANTSSWSDSALKRTFNIDSDSRTEAEKEKEDSLISLGPEVSDVETTLSVGLNTVFCQNPQTTSSCKRPKIAVATLEVFVSEEDHYPLQWEALGLKPISMEDHHLDLELRLGYPQRLK